MPTLPSEATPKTDALGPDVAEKKSLKKRNKDILQQIQSCRTHRRKLIQTWTVSIDYRRAKPFSSSSDEDRVAIPIDWSLTKEKVALLFSQVPQAHISHPPQTIAPDVLPWLHTFEQRVNDIANTAGIEAAMDEALPDCINAAGIGVIIVARESITEDVEVPAVDMTAMPPEVMESGLMPDGTPIPMEIVPRTVDSRYTIDRVSPGDFLWPLTFVGSDFDKSPWIGRDGRCTWPEAMKRFNLKPEDRDKYLGDDTRTQDRLTNDTDKERQSPADDVVTFAEAYYKEFQFDPDSKSFGTIHHVVFLGQHDVPVIDEAWKGQKMDPESQTLIGALKYPIRVLTLAYITDDAIPPSDSAIGRSQVDELNKSRTQMMLQREYSKPVRWADVNRMDPTVLHSFMRGQWQGVLPVQGNGQNIVGEIPRSAMPQENYIFDKVAKADLEQLWQVGQGSTGSDIETKAEVQAIGANMQTRISKDRARVGKFFCSILEVLGGLVSIYEDPGVFGEGFSPLVSKALGYSILSDSAVILNSEQRIKRLMDFINFTAKSGWLNIEPVLKEIATLHGLDPNVVIKAPQPKPPVEPNISLRLTGGEDMMNPLMLAFMLKSGQAPSLELIEQAKKLIEAGVIPPARPIPQLGPDGQLLPPPEDGGPPPDPAAPEIGTANPNWGALDRINKRVVER